MYKNYQEKLKQPSTILSNHLMQPLSSKSLVRYSLPYKHVRFKSKVILKENKVPMILKKSFITPKEEFTRFYRDAKLNESQTESRAMTAAAMCSKNASYELIKRVFPEKEREEREERVVDCKRIHDENYKQGIRFFADLIQNRSKRINAFLAKTKSKTPLYKKKDKPAKQLKRIIDNIKMLCSSYDFTTKTNIDSRQKRMSYGKWYLKPIEYSKCHDV